MAGDGYKVDLSALDQVIRKLNAVIGDLGKANADTEHRTYLPAGALGRSVGGHRFEEAEELSKAHSEMREYLKEVVRHLESVMDDFGGKTKKAHGAYQDAEADTSGGMHGAESASAPSSPPSASTGSMSGV
ncbi:MULTISPECIES: hypothetical protein [unclassified Streptomyces]|uniref:hypothetical protein n=1 Tax=unclassified Streptomyces TaxID=2593676 RepID=UPI003BB79F40